jgi:hypothetical protein
LYVDGKAVERGGNAWPIGVADQSHRRLILITTATGMVAKGLPGGARFTTGDAGSDKAQLGSVPRTPRFRRTAGLPFSLSLTAAAGR